MRPPFRARVCFLVALTLVACGACSFGHAQASPRQSSAPTSSSSPTTSSAAPSPAGDGSRGAARVDVDRAGGGSPAVVTVTLRPAGTGTNALNSLGPVVADCGLSDGTTRWIPFEIDFADHAGAPTKQDNAHANLAARVELRGAGSDVGVLLASANGDTPGCTTRGKLPTADSFSTEVIFGGYHVRTSGYVVARAGDALTALTLAVTGLEKKPDDIYPPGSWTWQVQRFESGSACPGSPASICVPLGG